MGFSKLTMLTAAAGLLAVAQPISFQIASVKSASAASEDRCAPNASVGQTFSVKNCDLGALILFAYDVLQSQVSGETSHLNEKYDITAKAERPVSRSEMRRMLQTLLADRFNLILRRETKEVPV